MSGTKRSGTSMWMQVLRAAGLPVLGQEFPRRWGESALRQANPDGFWESTLRRGVNFTTNPDPDSGTYLHPDDTRWLGVKVFLPGLTRTDLAYVHRVVVTVREWRQYCASVQRMNELQTEASGQPVRPRLAPALEWWFENFLGLRDVMQRRYPAHFTSYAGLVADPDDHLRSTLGWLASPVELDVAAAIATVKPELQTQVDVGTPADIDADLVEAFDELYDRIHRGRPFDRTYVEHLNAVHAKVAPMIHELTRSAELNRQFEREQQA